MKKIFFLYILFISMAFYVNGQQVLTIYPEKDAQLRYSTDPSHSSYATSPYGYSTSMQSGQPLVSMQYTTKLKALIGIDLSDLPDDASIVDAKLYLYGTGDHQSFVTMGFDYRYTPNTSYLRRVTSSWSENSVTWNTAPATVTDNQVTLASSTSASQNYVADVTDLIEDIQNHPDSSDGLMLCQIAEMAFCLMSFASSDNSDTTLHPKLEITYTSDFTEQEGFEFADTKWENVNGDDTDWSRDSNGTPSSSTGPSEATEGQYYAYIESSSPHYPNKTAIMQSPQYSFYKLDHPFIGFDYHMYGSGMGNLYLEASTDFGTSWQTAVWSKSGNQDNEWHRANVDLSDYLDEIVILRFRGVTGSSYTSDMAVDNITVYASTKTSPTGSENFIHTIYPMSKYGLEGRTSQNIQYIDGLGRIKQMVNVASSPSGHDMVKPVEYDNFGRVLREYLPFQEDKDHYGSYRDDAIADQNDFFIDHFNILNDDAYAFSRTIFEESTLNRIQAQGAPGKVFSPIEETGESTEHVKVFEYGTNQSNEVRYFSLNWIGSLSNTPTHYAAESLNKNSFEDEDGNLTEEFINLQGNVILKRSFNDSDTLSTYYVYDDLGLLRYVIPPKALGDNGIPSYDVRQQLCYKYTYDSRKRLITKDLPGVHEVYMLYDNRDRLVGVQDAISRKTNEWIFTKYDAQNRPVMTCKVGFSTPRTRSVVQGYIDTFYDNSSNKYYEAFSSSSDYGYTDQSYPTIAQAYSDTVLTVMYYDNYDFKNLSEFSGMNFDDTNNVDSYQDQDGTINGYFDHVIGQATGSLVLVLDGTDTSWIRSANYYDNHYRLIQLQSNLYPSGTNMISTEYDFNGNMKQSLEMQTVNDTVNEVLYQHTFDHTGRLMNSYITYNEEDAVLMTRNRYNELGQLEEKNLHSTDDIAFTQSVDYHYNMRGWLKMINDPDYLYIDNDLFGTRLYYDDLYPALGVDEKYNGNISAMVWSRDEGVPKDSLRAYVFEYDELNRIISSDYKYYLSWELINSPDYYETTYSYDLNGNIDSLTRRDESGTLIDDLFYSYDTTGNQLDFIVDASSSSDGVYDQNTGSSDYLYDNNGNLIWDMNKEIRIGYNHLNLPEIILEDSGTGDTLSYIYDAIGNKWLKTLNHGSSITKTMYAGSFTYEDTDNNTTHEFGINYILNPEGKIDLATSTPEYQYYLKDHLGNTRVVFNGANTVKQDIDYYPFGLTANMNTSSGENKYLYNGKELQDEQLGEVNLDWYDYGARFYDPALGRFHTLDPKAELFGFQSPYAYAANNPVLFIDENGENPGLLVLAALWEASGYIAGVLAATMVANKVYQDNVEGIRGTNDRPNSLKGTNTSRGNPTTSSNSNNNNFNPLENVDGAVITTVGTVALAVGIDQASKNEGSEEAEGADEEMGEMDAVCGEHLSQTDPEHWDSLDDEQREGYNAERNRQWQEHLLEGISDEYE